MAFRATTRSAACCPRCARRRSACACACGSALRKIALMLLRRNAIGGMGVGPMRKECAWDFSSAKRVFLGGEGEEAAA